MSENLSSQEIKRAAELANLANEVYQNKARSPKFNATSPFLN